MKTLFNSIPYTFRHLVNVLLLMVVHSDAQMGDGRGLPRMMGYSVLQYWNQGQNHWHSQRSATS
jgi:hypothetical protein